MKNFLLALIFIFLSLPLCSQVFQRGTIVTSQGRSIDCFIQHTQWNKEQEVNYLLKEGDQYTQSIKLANVSELRMENFLAKKMNARLDISSDKDELLSYERQPDWDNEVILLTVLVEGGMTLYAFEEEGTARFFYDSLGTPVQLVNKRFRTMTGVETNADFRQTLNARMNCSQAPASYFDQFVFSKENLVKHFIAENKCLGTKWQVYTNQMVVREEKDAPQKKIVVSSDTSDLKPARHRQYLGVEANQLARQMFNFGGNTNENVNPYLVQYSLNQTATGRGFAVGFNHVLSQVKDNPITTPRESKERKVYFRFGYDRKVTWGKRWHTVRGFDLVLNSERLLTSTTSQAGTRLDIGTRSFCWGFGPRFGLQFSISSRVVLATETSYYLRFTTNRQSFTGQTESVQKLSDFRLALPTTLLLTVRW